MEWTRVGAIRMNICLRIHVCTEVSMHMLFPFSVSSESLEAADTLKNKAPRSWFLILQ